MPQKLILASTSPYRRELLGRLGLPFEVANPQTDEARSQAKHPKPWPCGFPKPRPGPWPTAMAMH
jgi:predicted house-cleaning NTP pyrophosphatase (Maf/HAM1 superfamily)